MSNLLFCSKARNNEEYKQVVRKRRGLMFLFALMGVLTVGVVFAAWYLISDGVDESRFAMMSGIGVGLVLGGVVGCIRLTLRLKNEEQLKKYRLQENDERSVEINNRAFLAAARLMLVIAYLIMLSWGIVCEPVMTACELLIAIFFIIYLLFRKYYEKKM